jgi:hypothetical protein
LRERWGADFRSTTDVPSIVSFEHVRTPGVRKSASGNSVAVP